MAMGEYSQHGGPDSERDGMRLRLELDWKEEGLVTQRTESRMKREAHEAIRGEEWMTFGEIPVGRAFLQCPIQGTGIELLKLQFELVVPDQPRREGGNRFNSVRLDNGRPCCVPDQERVFLLPRKSEK